MADAIGSKENNEREKSRLKLLNKSRCKEVYHFQRRSLSFLYFIIH